MRDPEKLPEFRVRSRVLFREERTIMNSDELIPPSGDRLEFFFVRRSGLDAVIVGEGGPFPLCKGRPTVQACERPETRPGRVLHWIVGQPNRTTDGDLVWQSG